MTVVRRFHIKKSVSSTLACVGYMVAGLILQNYDNEADEGTGLARRESKSNRKSGIICRSVICLGYKRAVMVLDGLSGHE